MSRLICPRMAGPNPRLRADDGQPFHKSSKARLVDQPGITPLVDTSAFVGTNRSLPGLPVIRPKLANSPQV